MILMIKIYPILINSKLYHILASQKVKKIFTKSYFKRLFWVWCNKKLKRKEFLMFSKIPIEATRMNMKDMMNSLYQQKNKFKKIDMFLQLRLKKIRGVLLCFKSFHLRIKKDTKPLKMGALEKKGWRVRLRTLCLHKKKKTMSAARWLSPKVISNYLICVPREIQFVFKELVLW